MTGYQLAGNISDVNSGSSQRVMSMAEIAALKQASRDADARDLASGAKSAEQLRRETSLFASAKCIVVHVGAAKPLR